MGTIHPEFCDEMGCLWVRQTYFTRKAKAASTAINVFHQQCNLTYTITSRPLNIPAADKWNGRKPKNQFNKEAEPGEKAPSRTPEHGLQFSRAPGSLPLPSEKHRTWPSCVSRTIRIPSPSFLDSQKLGLVVSPKPQTPSLPSPEPPKPAPVSSPELPNSPLVFLNLRNKSPVPSPEPQKLPSLLSQ